MANPFKHHSSGIVAEYEALSQRIESIDSLRLSGALEYVAGDERILLADQYDAMLDYKNALKLRIALHEKANDVVKAEGAKMNFGQALEHLKDGKKLQRAGWNGKGMFVYLVPPASYPVQTGAAKSHFGEGSLVPYNAYFAIKNVDDTVSTWVPSVSDCLSEDWEVL